MSALSGQHRLEPAVVSQRHGHQFVVAVEQVGDGPLGQRDATLAHGGMDLRHALMLAVTQRPDQRDDVEPELVLRQHDRAFAFRPVRLVIAPAGRVLAPADLEMQANQPAERRHSAAIVITVPQATFTGWALLARGTKHLFAVCCRSSGSSAHRRLLEETLPYHQQPASFAGLEKKTIRASEQARDT